MKPYYAAQLLFQFRVCDNGQTKKRRICEIRTIVFNARDGTSPLARATRYGKSEQTDWVDGRRQVFLEFIGVKELLSFYGPSDPLEVWWDHVVLERPMERRGQLLPPRSKLRAFSVLPRRKTGPKV